MRREAEDDDVLADGESTRVRLYLMDTFRVDDPQMRRRRMTADADDGMDNRTPSDADVRDVRRRAEDARTEWIARLCDSWRHSSTPNR